MMLNWRKDKVFRLCDNVGAGGTPDTSNPDYYDGTIKWVQTGDLNDGLLSHTSKTITELGLKSSSAKLYPTGTLLIAMYGATIGKMGIIESPAATNQACCAMNFRKNVDTKYMFYKFLAIREPLIAQGYGGGQQNISQEIIKQTYVRVPRTDEQRRIAAYLDKTCAAIDTAIEKKQKQLEMLDALRKSIIHKAVTRGLDDSVELKDSGVEWIGKIPKHWKVEKMKRLLDRPLMYGTNEAAELDDPELPRYIRITDFGDNGALRDDTFKSLPPDKADGYYLSEGDVLFARSGATVGKSFLFKNYNGKACFAGYLIKARTTLYKCIPEYLYYFTKSPSYDSWKNIIFTQATIQNISATKYAYLPVTVPPIDEQKKILVYLDVKMAMIQDLQRNLSDQISTLEQYRKSLIHECVTGKRRIADEGKKDE